MDNDWLAEVYKTFPELVGMFGLSKMRYSKRVKIHQSWYDIQDGIKSPLEDSPVVDGEPNPFF